MLGHSVGSTREVWRKRFQRFARSGLPVVGFCAREGVPVASFYYWRKKLMPTGPGHRPVGRRAAFRPVTVVPAASGVSIHLPCGARIEVRAEDLDAVRTVVGTHRGLQGLGVSC